MGEAQGQAPFWGTSNPLRSHKIFKFLRYNSGSMGSQAPHYLSIKLSPKAHPFLRRMGLLLVLGSVLLISALAVSIQASEKPQRSTEIIVSYTQSEWWLIRWSTNQPECQIITDHEGLPNGDDVFIYCGEKLYKQWFATETCPEAISANGDTARCQGLYLHLISQTPMEKIVQVDLPIAEAWINLTGCTPIPPENRCDTLPNLLIIGEEPLPNEQIVQIQGTFNNIPFVCPPGETCEIPLRPTPLEGAVVEFWSTSSFGDSSEHYSALVRVIDGGAAIAPGTGGWYIDVMSDRWLGVQPSSCAQVWGTFPPIGGEVPNWLASPSDPQLLASDEPYTYLAGRLIANGVIDASECPAGGLEFNGYANTCGLEKSRAEVTLWQNQFDDRLVAVAAETNIPSQLMKNLFAQESQFWPGVYRTAEEYGFGQLTEKGADTVLLWNENFYFQFCPLVLSADICGVGYAQLDEESQALLRGALAIDVNADCADCVAGIDLSHADFTIDLFAQSIKANCVQTGQIVSNHTGLPPAEVSSYQELWRYTLVNYHAGPGCLSDAFNRTRQAGQPLNWGNVAAQLNILCPGAVEYVDKVAKE